MTPSAACACAFIHDEHTYEGWCGRWHYNEHAVIIYDAERGDGEQVGAVTLSDPDVERITPTAPIKEVRVTDIVPSPYTFRRMDDADHENHTVARYSTDYIDPKLFVTIKRTNDK